MMMNWENGRKKEKKCRVEKEKRSERGRRK